MRPVFRMLATISSARVRRIQERLGLAVDGIMGPVTAREVLARVGDPPEPVAAPSGSPEHSWRRVFPDEQKSRPDRFPGSAVAHDAVLFWVTCDQCGTALVVDSFDPGRWPRDYGIHGDCRMQQVAEVMWS